MQLITSAQRAALHQKTAAIDFEPVVKIFTPDGSATWLLTELGPVGGHLAFGLCDLGLGEPELDYVSLHELAAARWGFPSSAIFTSRRRERSRPTRISPASIAASSPNPLTLAAGLRVGGFFFGSHRGILASTPRSSYACDTLSGGVL